MLDALSQFNQGTVDELGIGVIRDALADILFPGTSTIQSRTRYFLIVPWIYQRVEARRRVGRSSAALARDIEAQVTESLRHAPDAKKQGIIGIEAGAAIRRPASEIYWHGVRKLGLRLFDGSRDRYHRWLDQQTRSGPSLEVAAESENEEVDPLLVRTWHPGIPSSPPGFPALDTLNLRPEEARYLREMIVTNVPDSLLAHLVRAPVDVDGDLPWANAAEWNLGGDVNRALDAARRFSELTYGALLFYNLLISFEAENADLIADYRNELDQWGRDDASRSVLGHWNLDELWKIVEPAAGPINIFTKQFIRNWQGLVADCLDRGDSMATLSDRPDARKLIRERERVLKQGRSRLGNPERLATWSGNSGAFRLNYRWPIVKSHVLDIQKGVFQRA